MNIKRLFSKSLCTLSGFILALLLSFMNASAQDKTGLMIIAHGSPSPKWNEPVLSLEKKISDELSERGLGSFSTVKVAMMEFTEPSISTIVDKMEREGVKRIFAMPLLIAPSSHSERDIPLILGHYFDKELYTEIEDESIKPVSSSIPVTLGPTLDYGDVLKNVMLERLMQYSKDPVKEGIVMLAHGDSQNEPLWDDLCRDIGVYLCASSGIELFDHAFVEVGQGFTHEGLPRIVGMYESGARRIIVLGLYVSLSPERIASRFTDDFWKNILEGEGLIPGNNLIYAETGLLPDEKITEWIADRYTEWLDKNN
jgi:hypothetical protein